MNRNKAVAAICGILAGVVSVATAPFMPIAVFIGIGVAVIVPSAGGVILLLSAVASIVLFGVTLHGVLGVMSVLAVILTVVAGVAALVTAFSQPATQAQPAA